MAIGHLTSDEMTKKPCFYLASATQRFDIVCGYTVQEVF